MKPLLLFTLLLFVLALHRISNPDCRWLYYWWRWEREVNERIERIKDTLLFCQIVTRGAPTYEMVDGLKLEISGQGYNVGEAG